MAGKIGRNKRKERQKAGFIAFHCTVCPNECFIKVDIPGKVKCTICSHFIYGHRGSIVLVEHVQSSKHVKHEKILCTNYALPGYMQPSGSRNGEGDLYGAHPMWQEKLKNVPAKDETLPKVVPTDDRVASAEAMVLCTVAEHSLPLSMAPVLVDLSRNLAKDPKSLTKLSLERTTAS